MWYVLHCSSHSAVLTLIKHHGLSQEREPLGGNLLMWIACGISVCFTELADGHDCEYPRERFVLRESLGKVRISNTVIPLGNGLQEAAKKSLAKKKKTQHIRAGEYRVTKCIFSLHLHIGSCALRMGSENVLEQNPEKSRSRCRP